MASYFNELGVDRNSHLLILDNTETMAKSDEDINSLVMQIEELFRKVGRVIVTSRRREAIEARQIEILPLTEDESIELLLSRANVLVCTQIKQAGVSTLRKFSNKLGCKPLMLEVFVQSLRDSSLSLQKAFDRVLRMQQQDLGEFLYSDAWNRMSPELRYLLLLMTRISDIHDDLLLKLCCMQAGVTVVKASEALEESRGIANISTISGRLQIVFNSQFSAFCEDRTVTIDEDTHPSISTIDTVKRRYNQFLDSANKKVYDRMHLAYRHALARAAWSAFQKGRLDDCELFYEEATVADNSNGWLFDRYAYFLQSRGRLKEALEKSNIATRILPEDPETWFTRGMIEARLGLTSKSVSSLKKANRYGKRYHLCKLQESYAHLNDSPANKSKARSCLDESEANTPRNDSLYWKHMAEIKRVRNRIEHL